MNELKQCPFCGCKAVSVLVEDVEFVECKNPMCTPTNLTPKEWNTRATDPRINELNAELDVFRKIRLNTTELQKENNELIDDSERLVEKIKKLKENTCNDGEYSFCRADGNKMGLGDALIIGQIHEDIDKALDQHKELMEKHK